MAVRRTAVRSRSPGLGDAHRINVQLWDWHPERVAVVVCDMWEAHHCVTASRRVVEMAPRMNEVFTVLRSEGALIVHAPADCMEFYRNDHARRRAIGAPNVNAPVGIDWCDWEQDELEQLPRSLTDPGTAHVAESRAFVRPVV